MAINLKITKYGVNMGRQKSGYTLLERLLNKVIVNDATDCWEWQGGKNNLGYGLIRDEKRMRTVHRVSYEEHNNTSIPKHLVVMHSCDNPKCTNPSHLSLGTRKDNTQDMMNKNRGVPFGGIGMTGKKQPRTICPHCHKDVPNNLYPRFHGDKCKSKI